MGRRGHRALETVFSVNTFFRNGGSIAFAFAGVDAAANAIFIHYGRESTKARESGLLFCGICLGMRSVLQGRIMRVFRDERAKFLCNAFGTFDAPAYDPIFQNRRGTCAHEQKAPAQRRGYLELSGVDAIEPFKEEFVHDVRIKDFKAVRIVSRKPLEHALLLLKRLGKLRHANAPLIQIAVV